MIFGKRVPTMFWIFLQTSYVKYTFHCLAVPLIHICVNPLRMFTCIRHLIQSPTGFKWNHCFLCLTIFNISWHCNWFEILSSSPFLERTKLNTTEPFTYWRFWLFFCNLIYPACVLRVTFELEIKSNALDHSTTRAWTLITLISLTMIDKLSPNTRPCEC